MPQTLSYPADKMIPKRRNMGGCDTRSQFVKDWLEEHPRTQVQKRAEKRQHARRARQHYRRIERNWLLHMDLED